MNKKVKNVSRARNGLRWLPRWKLQCLRPINKSRKWKTKGYGSRPQRRNRKILGVLTRPKRWNRKIQFLGSKP